MPIRTTYFLPEGQGAHGAQLIERIDAAWSGIPAAEERRVALAPYWSADAEPSLSTSEDGVDVVHLPIGLLGASPDTLDELVLVRKYLWSRAKAAFGRVEIDRDALAHALAPKVAPHYTEADVQLALAQFDGTDAFSMEWKVGDPPGLSLARAMVSASGFPERPTLGDVLFRQWWLHLEQDLGTTDAQPELHRALIDFAKSVVPMPGSLLAVPEVARYRASAEAQLCPRLSLGAEVPHEGFPLMLNRLRELADEPDDMEALRAQFDDEPDDRKRELFLIMEMLTNVVNDQVTEWIDGGGRAPDDPDAAARELEVLKEEHSVLSRPEWQRPVRRAYDLMRSIDTQVHREALEGGASPVQAVLNNIADGYDVLPSMWWVADVVRLMVRQHDPFVDAARIQEVVRNSRGLVTQLAALNISAQGAAQDALRVPEHLEGTIAPVGPGPDLSNFRYNPGRGRVEYRKRLSQFKVPVASMEFGEAWQVAGRHGGQPTVGDVIVDDGNIALTIGCPALVPLEPGKTSPLLQQWHRREVSIVAKAAHDLPPSSFTAPPDDLRAALLDVRPLHEVCLVDLPHVRVEVVPRTAAPSAWGDDAALAGLRFERRGGVLVVRGSGSAGSAPEGDLPVLMISPRSTEGSEDLVVRARNVGSLLVERAGKVEARMQRGGALLASCAHLDLDFAEGADVVWVPRRGTEGHVADDPVPLRVTSSVDAGREPQIMVFDRQALPWLGAAAADGRVPLWHCQPCSRNGEERAGLVWPFGFDDLPSSVRPLAARFKELDPSMPELPSQLDARRSALAQKVDYLRWLAKLPDDEAVLPHGARTVLEALRSAAAAAPAALAPALQQVIDDDAAPNALRSAVQQVLSRERGWGGPRRVDGAEPQQPAAGDAHRWSGSILQDREVARAAMEEIGARLTEPIRTIDDVMAIEELHERSIAALEKIDGSSVDVQSEQLLAQLPTLERHGIDVVPLVAHYLHANPDAVAATIEWLGSSPLAGRVRSALGARKRTALLMSRHRGRHAVRASPTTATAEQAGNGAASEVPSHTADDAQRVAGSDARGKATRPKTTPGPGLSGV